ncbi:MAG: NAD-dependent epimerase/dehydratase family protein [Planctomycetota bacterium]|nr:NAD-dependent epimerase/dehydratase family protein [Planctomycetota bacterium]
MKTLAVTGIGSDLGSRLLRIVEDDPNIDRVIGIDSKEPDFKGSKLKFHYHDNLERGYNLVFADEKADGAIYLKLSDTPGPDLFERNVTQFRHFIEAAAMARCKSVTLLSSITGYGAHHDNLEVLYEGSLLKPTSEFGRASAEIEKLCYEYVHKFPTALLQILRAAFIVGPEENNLITRALERSVMLVPAEAELAFQFVHVEDVARALHCMIDSECVGIFNLASDSALTIEQIAQLAERRLVRCPEPVLKFFMGCGRLINMKRQPWFERDALEHSKHSILVANIKFRHEVYFDFLFTSPEAYIESLLKPVPEEKGKTPTFAQELFEDDIETLDFLADMDPSPADEELEASLEKHVSETKDSSEKTPAPTSPEAPAPPETQGEGQRVPETGSDIAETNTAPSNSAEPLPQSRSETEKPAVN